MYLSIRYRLKVTFIFKIINQVQMSLFIQPIDASFVNKYHDFIQPIIRPITPFPGQIFSGQLKPHELESLMESYMNIHLLHKTSSIALITQTFNDLSEYVPHKCNLFNILNINIPEGTFIKSTHIKRIINETLKNSYYNYYIDDDFDNVFDENDPFNDYPYRVSMGYY